MLPLTAVPAEGDTVLVMRGEGQQRSSRVVVGKLAGSASPYPLPLGTINPTGQYVSGPNAHWGGALEPGDLPPDGLGIPGDLFWNTTVPAHSGAILYQQTENGWQNVL